MIQKFVTVPGFRVVLAVTFFLSIFAGTATVRAQQPQADQTQAEPAAAQTPAANQQSSSQESSPEETEMPRHRVKARDYKNWNFNVGAGGILDSGATRTFVRQGGGVGAAGVARNYNKYLGLRADFQWDDLPLRNSALNLAQAPGGKNSAYTLMVDPIITIPATRIWSAYIVFGATYLHRSGKLDSSTAIPGSACTPFWNWWGRCYAGSLAANGNFLNSSVDEFGLNIGGGVARKVTTNVEIYGEFRLIHATRNGNTTDFRPVTIGVRW